MYSSIIDPFGSKSGRKSNARFDRKLGNESVKSTHGDRRTAPAGCGNFMSRIARSNERAKPPPADSPATMMFSDLYPCASRYSYPEITSITALNETGGTTGTCAAGPADTKY